MSAHLLRDAIVYSKYANELKKVKRRENWAEAVDRTMNMHRKKLKKHYTPVVIDLINKISESVSKLEILPSMRSLQFGGDAILKKHAKIYNCSATYVDRPRVFLETFWMLLCGCGTGFSVQEHHVRKLPKISKPLGTKIVWTIEDSIEGWAYALGALLASYGMVGKNRILDLDDALLELSGHYVEFDYSKIRAQGSALSSGNGLAPGPEPLAKALETIRRLLDALPDNHQLRPYQCCDILLIASDAVMSGGVRRSASIALFSAWDDEMLDYKIGNWYETHPWRGRANVTALLLRNADEIHFEKIKRRAEQWGEPGIMWANTREALTNPCLPGYEKLKTPEGWKELKDVAVGDKVWGPTGWTNVVRKMNNGVKEVKRYTTERYLYSPGKSHFDATPEHRIINDAGKKEKVENAAFISVLEDEKHRHLEIIHSKSLGEMEVFDITVDNESNSYMIEGGYHVSNCGEIGLYAHHPISGESGWQVCNLTTINLTSCVDVEEFNRRCYLASALGTLQASYTSFPFLGKVTEDIIRNEALIGVSMTGIYDNLKLVNDPAILRNGANIVKQTNAAVAKLLGIRAAARCTTIKPEGTASLVCMSSSGIHPRHSSEYLRRVQYSATEPMTQILLRDAPELLEAVYRPDYKNPDDPNRYFSGYCAVFHIEAPDPTATEKTVTGLEMLETVKLFKKYWVDPGTNEDLCVSKTIKHNVSNTLKLTDYEIDAVFDEIRTHKDLLNGVSFLRKSGDIDWIAPPHVDLYPVSHTLPEVQEAFNLNNFWLTEREISDKTGVDVIELRKQYNQLWAERCKAFSGTVTWVTEGDGITNHNQTVACAGGVCELV